MRCGAVFEPWHAHMWRLDKRDKHCRIRPATRCSQAHLCHTDKSTRMADGAAEGGMPSPISAVLCDITEMATAFSPPVSMPRSPEAGRWKLRGSRNGSAARLPIARLAARMARPEWCTSYRMNFHIMSVRRLEPTSQASCMQLSFYAAGLNISCSVTAQGNNWSCHVF